MHWKLLEELRSAESEAALAQLMPRVSPPARLVEIGGGSGWQAREFAKAGYDVLSFDVSSSEYAHRQVFPVQDYDGHKLPVETSSADIIFSSNVLEHIPHVVTFQKEMLRVLRPNGIAVHILPTANWRFWTTLTHYPWVVAKLARQLGPGIKNQAPQQPSSFEHHATPPNHGSLVGKIRNNLLPPRHGEFGSVVTEHYYFSRGRWKRLFEATGWRVVHYTTNGIAYTGHSLCGTTIPIQMRRRMSRLIGSACHIFVLMKTSDNHIHRPPLE